MERAEEVLTMLLARAAGKQATRFLHARGLQKADCDDVISAALLWCLENKANYSLTTTLETWFMNAVRNAYQNFRRAETPAFEDSSASAVDDTTYNIVAAQSAASTLIGALTPVDKEIASLTMQGYTRAEIREQGYSKHSIDSAHRRIKQLRRLLPDYDLRIMSRTPRAPDPDKVDDTLSPIDVELERLEFAPPAGKECPPCWRCMWFEGFMPDGKRGTRMEIADAEVREAVRATEMSKMIIAEQVRDDTFGFNRRV